MIWGELMGHCWQSGGIRLICGAMNDNDMTQVIKLLAICGSTRQSSSNHHLIKAITELSAGKFTVQVLHSLTEIPHFNPDLDMDAESAPEAVQYFRAQLAAADAVLICTPEYAIGVPGTLKNAIDWTVSSMHFSKKPVALITAGTSGHKAHQSLLGTLLIIESKIAEDAQLVIPSVKTKVNDQGVITDHATEMQVRKLVHALADVAAGKEADLLPAPSLF
jgi:NAD(P)H-dependent FMN reductase